MALANRRVIDRVFVGNEAILLGDVTPDQLNDYIKRVRAALPNRIKVTTAEPWSTWLLTPETRRNMSISSRSICCPIGKACRCKDSLALSCSTPMATFRMNFPTSPSSSAKRAGRRKGRTRVNAEASLANEAYFVRNFVQLAMEKGYDYYLIEAYDQPWKGGNEGAVGAYWGLFDALGTPKFRLYRHAAHIPRMAHLCAAVRPFSP